MSEDWLFLIYDAAVVAMMCVFIWLGARNGFANAIIQAGGLILSVVASLALGKILASLVYTTAVQPGVLKAVADSIGNAVDTGSVVESLREAVGSMPWLARQMFDFSAAEKALSESVTVEAGAIAQTVEETVIRPVVEPIIETLVFLVTLIILVVVVETLAKTSKGVNKVPVVGALNAVLGGLTGAVTGAVGIIILAAGISLYITFRGETGFLSEETIGKTYIFRYIYNVVKNGFI